MTAFAALAVILAVFPLVGFTTAIPADAAPGLLSCNGTTTYSIEHGTTDGTLNALTTSGVGGKAVTTTAVSTIPGGGATNALGIADGGTAAYLVNQRTTTPNSVVIHHYDALAGTWNTFTGQSNVSDRFVAAAVDPVNGIYYYASFSPGTTTTPGTATIFGFDTASNTAIPGVIATMSLGDGTSTRPQNGDIAFDRAGNMYLLSSDTVTTAIQVVRGPLPTTGSANGVTLTSTLLTSFASAAEYVGIAFDNTGGLTVLDFTSANVSEISKLNPQNGALLSGPTPESANAQTFMNDDLGSCMVPPALTLQKNVASRFATGDQFRLSITGGGLSTENTATTSGSAAGLQSAKAGPVDVMSGTVYRLSESGAGGAMLGNYRTAYSCVDTANGSKVVASGTGQSFTLPFPATVGASPTVVCTFTNTALQPGISIVKSASPTTFSRAGQTITYSFLVTNTGQVTLTDVGVTDNDLPGLSPIGCPRSMLAPGAHETCTATYVTTQADVSAGKILNAATSHGLPPGSTTPVVSPPSRTTVRAVVPVTG